MECPLDRRYSLTFYLSGADLSLTLNDSSLNTGINIVLFRTLNTSWISSCACMMIDQNTYVILFLTSAEWTPFFGAFHDLFALSFLHLRHNTVQYYLYLSGLSLGLFGLWYKTCHYVKNIIPSNACKYLFILSFGASVTPGAHCTAWNFTAALQHCFNPCLSVSIWTASVGLNTFNSNSNLKALRFIACLCLLYW